MSLLGSFQDTELSVKIVFKLWSGELEQISVSQYQKQTEKLGFKFRNINE